MWPDDLAAVEGAYNAFARGDVDALRERYLHPQIEWRTTAEVPFLGTYNGIDEFLVGMAEWVEPFDEITTEVMETVDAGDRVVVGHRMRGRGHDSGVDVELLLWQVVTVRDGKLERMHDYTSRQEALEAVGS